MCPNMNGHALISVSISVFLGLSCIESELRKVADVMSISEDVRCTVDRQVCEWMSAARKYEYLCKLKWKVEC